MKEKRFCSILGAKVKKDMNSIKSGKNSGMNTRDGSDVDNSPERWTATLQKQKEAATNFSYQQKKT